MTTRAIRGNRERVTSRQERSKDLHISDYRLTLHGEVDGEGCAANLEDGVLRLRLPKTTTGNLQRITHVFDSFECAIHRLAPVCEHCGCKIIGHGLQASPCASGRRWTFAGYGAAGSGLTGCSGKFWDSSRQRCR